MPKLTRRYVRRFNRMLRRYSYLSFIAACEAGFTCNFE